MSIKQTVLKQKSIFTKIGFITLSSVLFLPGSLYGIDELFGFSLPANPQGRLTQETDGNFYGTTAGTGAGDYGSVFKMTPGGVLTTLVSFKGTNGSHPVAALVQGSDDNFYGTTEYGGTNGGNGTVFEVSTNEDLICLYSFTGGNDGAEPNGLVQGSDGYLYGTTQDGGTNGFGTVFRMSTNGELTTLYSFGAVTNGFIYPLDGAYPSAGLVQGRDGNFYGTTSQGGESHADSVGRGYGTVFTITTNGALTTIHDFGTVFDAAESPSPVDGGNPATSLMQGSDGNFYGTTSPMVVGRGDGTLLPGTVFQMTPAGVLTTLVTFSVWTASSGLVEGSDGNFYGTTEFGGNNGIYGGYGTVFQVTPTGVLTILVLFNGSNGANPQAGLVQGSDGNLYGTTTYIGGLTGDATPWDGFGYIGPEPPTGAGCDATVFKVTPAGALTTLFSFISMNGYDPNAGLVQGNDGNFYGTTTGGGMFGAGTVFEMTPAGALTTLVSFNGANGYEPLAALVQGTNGNFYGTTWAGGVNNLGTVFQMTPTGVLTTLVSLNGANGANPHAPLVQGSDGNFYGTTFKGGTSGNGTLFKISSNGTLTSLYSFGAVPGGAYGDPLDGANPYGGLVQGTDGNFYGTTSVFGPSGYGTVFKITPVGLLTTLVSLPYTIGPSTEAGLVQGRDGNFYGTTMAYGSVFRMTPGGVLTTLVGFGDNLSYFPQAGLVQGADGNFYGTTYYDSVASPGYVGGTVFKVTAAGVLTTLVSFDGTNGNGPQAGLIQGRDGNFYGTTDAGGSHGGGNIFRITSLQSSPPITATTASNQIIVSWPEDYPAFTLQTTTNLNPPVNWLDATDSPILLSGQFTVTNSLSGSKFYRLKY
jgi:uncharacterized repeat protein (TIGR03803 family)